MLPIKLIKNKEKNRNNTSIFPTLEETIDDIRERQDSKKAWKREEAKKKEKSKTKKKNTKVTNPKNKKNIYTNRTYLYLMIQNHM